MNTMASAAKWEKEADKQSTSDYEGMVGYVRPEPESSDVQR